MDDTFKACELGGGAHPDRYHEFFDKLIQANGKIDRVDVSPYMLELAKTYIDTDEYKNRLPVISFIESEIAQYLRAQEDNSIDLAIMKYTIDHIADLDVLFALLQKKLKPHGALVSSIGVLTPQLKSMSTNARFLYNGEEFPIDETRELHDGDSFTVKFFTISGNPKAGHIPGAETTKYYHSEKKYRELATKHAFEIYLGDRK
ncbi:MAG: methyltransferase domain-containing protein [bacterium]